ncbi:hypothetical protein DNTS_010026 [Danionella cerebrum]|uniref:SH2 domain-containing protein n=1 Tax=Danionella cerebrum TaxID=2873325 RepID=A0A553QZ29_9TELE|nr:hypothetical protein DNTS_010026 [Danionella translucida]
MAATNRCRRARSQLTSCYYEGFLEKKSIKDKMGRKLWASLCGDSLFFFNKPKDSVYIDKLELSDLMSVSDDHGRERNLNAAGFTMHMKKEDIKMILSVPLSLNLLPGQIHMMKEIIDKEKRRQQVVASPPAPQSYDPYVCVVPEMPLCFHYVSRIEAEILLEKNSSEGNLLLRPGHDGTSFALTTRQEINGSVFKHYRVSRKHEGGFTIDLESPITCATLQDVVNRMVEKAGGVFVPLEVEDHYAKNISIVKENEENGELTEHCPKPMAPSSPPAPPPKPVGKSQRSSSEPTTSENQYLNTSDARNYDEIDEGAFALPTAKPRPPESERKALFPPGYKNIRSNSLSGTSKPTPNLGQQYVVMNELAQVISSRRAGQE